MKKKTVSIKNIAEHLNISVTTVSFVLNGKAKEKHISKILTQKVLDYAQKVNYKPNQIAQSLRTGKSKILVFMVEDISNYFFSKLARIIEDIAYDKGYKVIFCSNENQDTKSLELIELFKNRQVDGFIIVPSPGIKSMIAELIEENHPIILLDRYFSDLECNSVVIDNQEATFDATNHLIANNYKNIAFITTDSDQMQMQNRLFGYENAIVENNLKPHVLKIPYKEANDGKSKDFIKKFIDETKKLDAVFFATNYLTQAGLEAFKENNPEFIHSLGIITFDDNELFKIYSPTITAVSQPLEAIGNKLMELMLRLLKQKDVKEISEKIILNAELKIRESSQKRSL
ncbi:LacI family DNA-binding transcriptional regulator [Flavobacterium sp. 5]|uniref:LacI family DNA-binding transcriptional regulator n=1 Tax=Flavobacterium sp. 5 TaxID=2035199 RepID=UPI000C2C9FE3|nr:LacI family DNA-binding transcriptional regulator [Flavobacterium sp. 5]PKB15152.1 LacI family transcriptional regulator [Flavobacterium sp. 5]